MFLLIPWAVSYRRCTAVPGTVYHVVLGLGKLFRARGEDSQPQHALRVRVVSRTAALSSVQYKVVVGCRCYDMMI